LVLEQWLTQWSISLAIQILFPLRFGSIRYSTHPRFN